MSEARNTAATRSRGMDGPTVAVDGYEGALDHLLEMSRAKRIDLLSLPLLELVEQLVDAIAGAAETVPVGERAGWMVQAATVVQTWSRLRFADGPEDRKTAEKEADALRRDLIGRAHAKALAEWLAARPQAGIDRFARGCPEDLDAHGRTTAEPDRVAFLWALAKLLDADLPKPTQAAGYRPHQPPPHTTGEARARIERWLLDGETETTTLAAMLPPGVGTETRRRIAGAWTTTFVAALELSKQGVASLNQEGAFSTIGIQKNDRNRQETTRTDI